MTTSAVNGRIFNGKKNKRINFLAPEQLVSKIGLFAEENQLTESDLIRQAISSYIDELEKKKLEEQIKEACENYREFNKQFSGEWAQFETRIE